MDLKLEKLESFISTAFDLSMADIRQFAKRARVESPFEGDLEIDNLLKVDEGLSGNG